MDLFLQHHQPTCRTTLQPEQMIRFRQEAQWVRKNSREKRHDGVAHNEMKATDNVLPEHITAAVMYPDHLAPTNDNQAEKFRHRPKHRMENG